VLKVEQQSQLNSEYDELGYFVIRNYFSAAEISALRDVVLKFHENWKADNIQFYRSEAFNSSVITGIDYLECDDRLKLFNFISSKKMMDAVESVIPEKAAFMNTQLFFNPYNPKQKDFWHRDCQYDFGVEEQKIAVQETQVVHLRVPLFDELGMELIPGTHKRWDNEEEFNVRQEINGKVSCDSIEGGQVIGLAAGDILVFSADMIHRGLYGMDRLALDILVFDPAGDFADYVDDECLPSVEMLDKIEDPRLFNSTLALKQQR